MKNIFFFVLATTLMMHLFAQPIVAQSKCTAKEMIELKNNDFSVDDIKKLCSPESENTQQKSQSTPEKDQPTQQGSQPTPDWNQQAQQRSPYQQQKVQMGQRCATQFGICGLYHLPPAPVGTPCYCINRFTGQPDNGRIIP